VPFPGRAGRDHVARPILHLVLGTAINVAAVLAGGSIGMLVGTRLSVGIRQTAMHAIGIVTLLVGVSNFLVFDRTSTQVVLTLTLVAVQ